MIVRDSASPACAPQSSTLDRLRRWEQAGAGWQVVHDGHTRVVIVLLSCDGGEEIDRLTTDDPDAISYVRARGGSS